MTERDPIIVHSDGKRKPYGVLITGKRYAGKDTFSMLLQQELEKNNITAVIESTALQLKKRFCAEMGLDENLFLTDRTYKEEHREELTDYVLRHSQEENIASFLESLKKDQEMYDVIIVSDVRNLFDHTKIAEAFGVFLTIRISSIDAMRQARGLITQAYDQSVFETEMDAMKVDFDIHNNGTIDQLRHHAATVALSIVATKPQ